MTTRIMSVAGIVLMLGAIAIIWPPLTTSLAVDSCLDAGGSFNYAAGVCDFERSHPYEPIDNTLRFGVASASALIGFAVAAAALYGRRKA